MLDATHRHVCTQVPHSPRLDPFVQKYACPTWVLGEPEVWGSMSHYELCYYKLLWEPEDCEPSRQTRPKTRNMHGLPRPRW